MRSERQIYPDVIKGIAIILVVIGHNIQFGSGANYLSEQLFYDNFLFKIIYSFHMPLFMVISGFFFSYTVRKYKIKEILRSRVLQLFVPILMWSLIPFGVVVLKTVLDGSLSGYIVFDYIEIVISNLWFLWAIIFNSLIVLMVSKLRRGQNVVYIIIFLLLFILPDNYKLAEYKYMYPYFVAGYMWNQHKDVTSKIFNWMLNRKCLCVVLSFVVFSMLLCFFNKTSYIYTTGITIWGDYGVAQIITNLYRWLIGGVGCVLVLFVTYLVLMKLGESSKIIKCIGALGVESMGIYIISDVINKYIIGRVTAGVDFDWIILLCETIFVLVGCFVATKILKNFKFARTLLLGSR